MFGLKEWEGEEWFKAEVGARQQLPQRGGSKERAGPQQAALRAGSRERLQEPQERGGSSSHQDPPSHQDPSPSRLPSRACRDRAKAAIAQQMTKLVKKRVGGEEDDNDDGEEGEEEKEGRSLSWKEAIIGVLKQEQRMMRPADIAQ